MKTLQIKIDDREIVLQKLPIGEYADILKAIKELPKHFSTVENLNVDQLIQQLPFLAGDCMPDVINVIALAAKLPKDDVEQMGLDDIAKLIEGIYEVNNFSTVAQILKKALAHPAVEKIMPKKTT